MNNKIMLLAIAVISVGLFAMPTTLSLFSGQHTFYAGEDVKCEKCHQDIYNEMTSTSSGSTAHRTTALQACEGCHKSTVAGFSGNVPFNGTSNLSYTYTLNITSNPNAHAAVTLECIACHQGVPAELAGSQEAHTSFYFNATYSASIVTNASGYTGTTQNQTAIALKGANTACVGCHTHTIMNITWSRRPGYNMNVDSSTGAWTMTFTVNTTQSSVTYSAGQ